MIEFRHLLFLLSAGACMAEPSQSRVAGRTAEDTFEGNLSHVAAAACAGDAARVRDAIEQGVSPNAQGYGGVTLLLWTVNCESVEGTEALLDAGADPNLAIPARGGSFSAVFAAVRNRNPAVLRALLEHGGDANAAYEGGAWTALKAAYGWGLETDDWSNYDALLEHGADINRTHAGQTIVEFAASLNGWERVADLLERGYSGDLQVIARFAGWADPEVMDDDQERGLVRVREILRGRGVEIPVPPRR